jgi:hypothetical protein
MRCRRLLRFANAAFLSDFLCSGLLHVAPYCVTVVSEWCHQHPRIHLRFRASNPNRRVPDYSADVSPLALAFSYASLRLNELPLRLLPKCYKTFAQPLLDICRPVMQSY